MDFDRLASNYNRILDETVALSGEGGTYFARYKARFAAHILGSGYSGKILDFGCGVGNNAVELKTALPNSLIHGFDVSKESLNKIPAPLLNHGKFSSTLSDLDPDYDLIFLANVLHHVDLNQRADVIAKLKDRLKSKGRILIFEHNPFNPVTQWSVRHSPIDVGVRLLTRWESIRLLREGGFRLLKKEFIVFFPAFLAFLRPLEPHLGWCPLGAQYAVLAEYSG